MGRHRSRGPQSVNRCRGAGRRQPRPIRKGCKEGAAGPFPVKPCKLDLGLASYTTRKCDLDKTLEIAQRAGLKSICLKSVHLPLDAKAKDIVATSAKIHKAGFVLYSGGVVTMKKEQEVNQAFDYAKAAGMARIIAAPSPEMLPLVDRKIKQYGIGVSIHNHGPTDKYFPTPESVYEAVKALDPRLGLCIDIGHTVRVGADLIASTEKYHDRLFDIHIKDVTAAAPEGHEVPVGRGIIDIPRFLAALVRLKFAGVVAFEYEPEPDDPLPGLAESVGYTRGVLTMT